MTLADAMSLWCYGQPCQPAADSSFLVSDDASVLGWCVRAASSWESLQKKIQTHAATEPMKLFLRKQHPQRYKGLCADRHSSETKSWMACGKWVMHEHSCSEALWPFCKDLSFLYPMLPPLHKVFGHLQTSWHHGCLWHLAYHLSHHSLVLVKVY